VPLAEEKVEARKQWSGDPCGAVHGRELEPDTREFFDAIEHHRYSDYAPWMPVEMGFDRFPGKRLLEVGCGMGTDLLQFARGGAHCTGLDLTPRSIGITRQRFALYGEGGDFLISDCERLPFRNESFDVVYSNGVLHHTPDTAGAIREIHRVLRPTGIAKVMLYHRHSLYYWVKIILHLGVLKGALFRGESPGQIMSRHVEYSEHGGRPLVKVYSAGEARKLFDVFRAVHIRVDQLTRNELPAPFKGMPERAFRLLRRIAGWNLIITGEK
jgi:SAM-dependent methyltransferase